MHGIGDESAVDADGLGAVVGEVLAHGVAGLVLGVHAGADLADEVLLALELLKLGVVQHTGDDSVVQAVGDAGLDLGGAVGSGQGQDGVVALGGELLDGGFLSSGVLELLGVSEGHVVVLGDVVLIVGAEAEGLFTGDVGDQNADLNGLVVCGRGIVACSSGRIVAGSGSAVSAGGQREDHDQREDQGKCFFHVCSSIFRFVFVLI